ncbi:TPA: RHS repeat-associated core domain-containing protein, partial [Streptococcus suis]|nr:RHS repeat-associated core domain-containing protein [Streptococcus suis]HEM5656311.1 RHS repeat-associated core domain-containing protein [Streptococcus suis]
NSVASSSYNLYGATKQTTDTTGNPFAYNGEARDVTGLDYLRARYYDSQAGTFLTADSYSGSQTDPLSQNLYAYVQNNPANYTDPSGHIGRPNINLPDSRGSRQPKRSSQSKSNQSKVYPIFPSGTSIIDQQLIIANQSAAQGLVDAQKRFIQETKGYSYNPIVDMFRDPLGPSRSPIDYGSTPFATITRSYIDSVLTTARQTVYTPPPSDYERAVQSGQSTYDWSRSTTREAKNIHRNWTKALEETIRHVCNTQTAKGKDSGTQNKPNISVADFRKIEEANKYGLTVAEKAKIDKMSMSDLKSQYSSVIGNYNTYVGTGYFNPLGIGENRAVIERYKILKAEEEAKAAAQAAELAKYHYLNLYKHIQETGLRPDGTPATDLEKKIAPYVVAIPIIQDLSVAFAGRQYAKHNPHIPIENGMKWGVVNRDVSDNTKQLALPHPMENANYAQKTYNPKFSEAGANKYTNMVGEPILSVSDLANAIKNGKIDPSKLSIDYINRDGNILILNTRTSQALTQADIPRNQWSVIDRTGNPFFEEQLNGQLHRNKLTSEGISTVRIGGGK